MSDPHYTFEIELEVRDYECDLQGVVNNAVYQNYLEHARHQYLRGLGLDFAGLHERGYDLVLTRSELDYQRPLRSGDRFAIRLRLEQASQLRFLFVQDIFKLPSGEHVLHGRFTGTCLGKGGRPCFPPELQAALHRAASPNPNQG